MKRHTKDNYIKLATSLDLTWCGPDLPQNNNTKTNWRCSDPQHPPFPSTYHSLLYNQLFGCPRCRRIRAIATKNLEVLHPEIAKYWHPTLNELHPSEVTPSSHRKVYWVCVENPVHHYERNVYNRVNRAGALCAQCNSLAEKRPDLIPEWHPTKNGDLRPEDVSCGIDVPVWWQCQFDPSHEWQASPNNRTAADSGCPICNKQTSKLEVTVYTELLTLFPDTEWGEIVHGKEIDVFIPSINVGIEVDGSRFHTDSFDRDVEKNTHFKSHGIDILRLREDPMPKIANFDIQHEKNDKSLALMKVIVQRLRKMRPEINTNAALGFYLKRKKKAAVEHYREIMARLPIPPFEKSLEHLHPEIASTWDLEKNIPWTPSMFKPTSHEKVYWHCPLDGHPSFRYSIGDRLKQNGCQICTGRKVTDETSVAVKLDKIRVHWHPTKNLPTTPDNVRHKESTIKVWWLCPGCEHEWEATPIRVIHMVTGTGCRLCGYKRGARVRMRNRIAKHGSLAKNRPDVVKFIDPDRSPDFDPTLVLAGSNDRVYIRCPSCMFEWPNNRSITDLSKDGALCKKCRTRLEGSRKPKNRWLPVTKVWPQILKIWDAELDPDISLSNFSRGSGQKIHVLCERCRYKWPNSRLIKHVVQWGFNCPKCKHKVAPYDAGIGTK